MYSLLHGVPHCTVTQASLPTYSHFVFPMDSIRSGVVRKKIGGGDFLATLMATHLPAFGGPPCLLAPFSVSLCWTSVHSEFGLVADDALEGVGHGLRSVGRGSPSPAAAVAQTALARARNDQVDGRVVGALRVHGRTHTGEKPLACSDCS